MTTPRDDIGLSERLRFIAPEDDMPKTRRVMLEAATQLDALCARVKELEAQRDDALEQVEELERNAEIVSDEFEKDCWKALRSLLVECKFDWRDVEPDGVSADDAREYIHDTLNELESSWQRERDRATRAEQERDEAYERAAGVADNAELISHDPGECRALIVAAIRRLAAGPDKEK